MNQKRIDRENKALQGRLTKVATKSNADAVNDVYGADNGSNNKQGSATSLGNNKQRAQSAGRVGLNGINRVIAEAKGESKADAHRADMREASDAKASYNDLLDTFTAMKKEVGDMEKDNQGLKAHLTRLTFQAKKYELSTEKLRKQVSSLPIAAGGAGASSSSASRPSTARATGRTTGDVEDRDGHGGRDTDHVNDDEDNEFENVKDKELRELLIEYKGLQDLRRALVERTRKAKELVEKATDSADKSEELLGVARARVAMIFPGAVELDAADERYDIYHILYQ
jgi:hypothetical protein